MTTSRKIKQKMPDHALPSKYLHIRGGTLPKESWKSPNSSIYRREQGAWRSYLRANGNLRLHWGAWGKDTVPNSIGPKSPMFCLWSRRCILTLQRALLCCSWSDFCLCWALFTRHQSRVQGEAGQLVPNEQWEETRAGSLTEEASWAED